MAATRCIRCTRVATTGDQFCEKCRSADELVSRAEPTTALDATCASCGSPVAYEGARFCSSCGSELSAQEARYAGFWMRFLAYVIDMTLLGTLTVGLFVVTPGQASLAYLSLALSLAYYAGFETWFAATPGKMPFGMNVKMANGDALNLKAGVIRYLGHIVSGFLFGVGFLMIAFTRKKRGLHDYMANTIVVVERD